MSEENSMRINCNKNTYSQISKELNKASKTIEALTKELIQNELIIEYNNQYIINPKYV
jgi:predicted transcriptional regulator